MENAYIGFGSNLDNPEAQCLKALELIGKIPHTQIIQTSSFYRSEPLTMNQEDSQPWYINGVVEVETELNPRELFQALQKIETQMGRVREKKWASRTIDLDLLIYGQECSDSESLKLPHPEIRFRNFVLVPLEEIQPDLIIPGIKVSLQELIENLIQPGKLEKISRDQ